MVIDVHFCNGDISEQIQKVLGLCKIRKEKKMERKMAWRETHLRSIPNLLLCFSLRWLLRSLTSEGRSLDVWAECFPLAAFILADRCRHTGAGVVVQDRAQLDALNDRPIGSSIFHLETKEKNSGEDSFDVWHQPQVRKNDFFFCLFVQNLQTN